MKLVCNVYTFVIWNAKSVYHGKLLHIEWSEYSILWEIINCIQYINLNHSIPNAIVFFWRKKYKLIWNVHHTSIVVPTMRNDLNCSVSATKLQKRILRYMCCIGVGFRCEWRSCIAICFLLPTLQRRCMHKISRIHVYTVLTACTIINKNSESCWKTNFLDGSGKLSGKEEGNLLVEEKE